ncbi:YjbF family lipoprotein [Pseudoroseomonas globiformis]|uniref:YjbF family lipoprotein n=1 Tax=Teichococcus globiformis TaxID=2307229 RepID=A0ABV7G2N8_9PROT
MPVPDHWIPTLWETPEPVAEPDSTDPAAAVRPVADGTPSVRLSWGRGTALALLVSQNGENRMWRSAGGVVVATDGARIVATAGLREWIASTRIDGPDPLDEPLSLASQPVTLRRQVDLMRGNRAPSSMRFGVALNCRISAARQGPALVVRENCRGTGPLMTEPGWFGGVFGEESRSGFTNRYWADPATGGIYRSEQWVGEAGMMRLEVVTPPS